MCRLQFTYATAELDRLKQGHDDGGGSPQDKRFFDAVYGFASDQSQQMKLLMQFCDL